MIVLMSGGKSNNSLNPYTSQQIHPKVINLTLRGTFDPVSSYLLAYIFIKLTFRPCLTLYKSGTALDTAKTLYKLEKSQSHLNI
jgi:hypothetical protein